MSRIRTNIITNRMVDGAPVVSTGLRVTGVCTATSFSGDGSNLSGLASREVYGFTGIGKSLSLTTTNSGADNIDAATFAAFEENFIGPSGLSFSINTSGNTAFTRLGKINVATGATFHVSAGTTLIMNVLNVF